LLTDAGASPAFSFVGREPLLISATHE
jgi:hypothetical protein